MSSNDGHDVEFNKKFTMMMSSAEQFTTPSSSSSLKSKSLKEFNGTLRKGGGRRDSNFLEFATNFPKELEKELRMWPSRSAQHKSSERRTYLFGWGMNTNGQLGFSPYVCTPESKGVDILNLHDCAAMTESVLGNAEKKNRDAHFPRLTWIPEVLEYDLDIISVATSYYHSLIVDSKGQCYSFGGGENGTLGLGYEKIEQNVPRRILHLPNQVIMVAAGRFHSLALTQNGDVYSWGSSKDGKLGLGDLKENKVPAFLNYPKRVRCEEVSLYSLPP